MRNLQPQESSVNKDRISFDRKEVFVKKKIKLSFILNISTGKKKKVNKRKRKTS